MRVKICGVRDPDTVAQVARAGAAYVGFVLFDRSPRAVGWDAVAALAAAAPPGLCKVALVVDPDDAALDRLATLPVDMIQLHGRETPQRVAQVRARVGLPVMKALGVAGPQDLTALDAHEAVADQLLVDAKPPAGADRPGGHGAPFDWALLAGRRWRRPWLLAGGLTAANVAGAAAAAGAAQVDVSSGVETAPGVKDPGLIAAFVAAAQG